MSRIVPSVMTANLAPLIVDKTKAPRAGLLFNACGRRRFPWPVQSDVRNPSSGKWFRILGDAATGTRATPCPSPKHSPVLFIISVEKPIARHD
jgi:hypothetical protein